MRAAALCLRLSTSSCAHARGTREETRDEIAGVPVQIFAVKREMHTHRLGAGAGHVSADVAGDVHELAAGHAEVRQGPRINSHRASMC